MLEYSKSRINKLLKLCLVTILAALILAPLVLTTERVEAGWGNTDPGLVVYVSPPNGGKVSLGGLLLPSYPDGQTYQSGTSVAIEAIPAPGYRFIRWSGDIEGTTKSITLQIDRSMVIQANFTRIVPNWLIAIIIIAISTPLLLRWRRRRLKQLS